MPLSLITDRTQANVDQLKAIKAKLNAGTALTTAEQAAWAAGKGGNNIADLNRVGAAVAALAATLAGYGYSVTVNPRTDWSAAENPQQATEMAAYLADVQALKDGFYGATPLPADMAGVTVGELNNIEKLLLEIERNITWMVAGFRKCGTFKSGQGVILP